MSMPDSDTSHQFEACAYYHTAMDGSDLVAGYGIWDKYLEDWFIAGGFATLEAAQTAVDLINKMMDAVEKDTRAHWRARKHGKAAGEKPCEICDDTEGNQP